MIDLDATAEPQPRRRSRIRIYVAAALAVLLVAGGATAYLVHRYSGTQVRFEVESASGSIRQISWHIGSKQVAFINNNKRDEPLSAPWSTTVTAEEDPGRTVTVLTAQSSRTDEVTCRIIIEGEVVVESTNVFVAGCVLGLERAKESAVPTEPDSTAVSGG